MGEQALFPSGSFGKRKGRNRCLPQCQAAGVSTWDGQAAMPARIQASWSTPPRPTDTSIATWRRPAAWRREAARRSRVSSATPARSKAPAVPCTSHVSSVQGRRGGGGDMVGCGKERARGGDVAPAGSPRCNLAAQPRGVAAASRRPCSLSTSPCNAAIFPCASSRDSSRNGAPGRGLSRRGVSWVGCGGGVWIQMSQREAGAWHSACVYSATSEKLPPCPMYWRSQAVYCRSQAIRQGTSSVSHQYGRSVALRCPALCDLCLAADAAFLAALRFRTVGSDARAV